MRGAPKIVKCTYAYEQMGGGDDPAPHVHLPYLYRLPHLCNRKNCAEPVTGTVAW